ncbi:hypothetical protein ASE30_18865 [Achromobacter sp. Root83]|nr:hypothetical protein ASE30_18865 [Achromobacter sp. Root83]
MRQLVHRAATARLIAQLIARLIAQLIARLIAQSITPSSPLQTKKKHRDHSQVLDSLLPS